MTARRTFEGLSLLHQVFERQAELAPDAVAVEHVEQRERVTYRELNNRANRLAFFLAHRGVGPGSVIGILLPRGIGQYVSMLAVLKAGGAYLPIDPGFPLERIALTLEDSGAGMVITTKDMWRTSVVESCTPVFLDRMSLEDAAHSRDLQPARRPSLRGEDLCYVIYTSGTTGRPKGICISHRNIMTYVRSIPEIYQARPTDRVLQGFPTAFDASLEEIWIAFSAGATLVVGALECMQNVHDLPARLREFGITVFSTVPTLLEVMPFDELPNVHLLIVGGEASHQDVIDKWSRPGRIILNTYGPTECSVAATYARCVPGAAVTIGRPFPGYAVTLLDERLQEVSEGERGELCVRGPGVSSRGYLNRPELTEERFIHHRRGRMYRTGDLAYRNENGELVYCGRIDSQVKIRGFRVELEEIEAQLSRLNGIDGAVASVQPDDEGTPVLAAYLLLDDPARFEARKALSWLKRQLPDYMIPAQFVALHPSEVPRLTSGKIDRNALPALSDCMSLRPTGLGDVTGKTVMLEAEGTPLEEKLRAIWCAVFQHAVQMEDSFFDLGGHSLLAARVISRCRKDPALARLSIRDLYECRTIRALAARVQELQAARPASEPAVASDARAGGNRSGLRVSALTYGFVTTVQCLALLSLTAAAAYVLYGSIYGIYLLWAWLAARTAYWPLALAATFGVGVPVAALALTLVLGVCCKRFVVGRFRETDLPLWSVRYLRWWLANLALAPIRSLAGVLSGTPLAPFIYRMLGARIGTGVYLGSSLPEADLVTIEDGASIGAGVILRTHFVEGGYLKLRRIHIGEGAFIGPQSVLCGSVTIGEGSRVYPLSCVTQGTSTRPGSEWQGSPAVETGKSMSALSMLLKRHERGYRQEDSWATWSNRLRIGGLQCVLLYLWGLAFLLPVALEIFLLYRFDVFYTAVWALDLRVLLPATLLFSSVRFLGMLIAIVAMKWLVTGRARFGTVSLSSFEYVRRWFAARLMTTLVDPRGIRGITETVFMPAICRLLGMRVGRGTEISDATGFQPDLVVLGDYSMLADRCVLGAPIVHRGSMTLGTTVIGHRAFVANAAHVPMTAAGVNNGCLVGVLSTAPDRMEPGSSWLGSPPVRFPRRHHSGAPAGRTTHPPRHLVVARTFCNLWKMILPGALVEMLLWTAAACGVRAFVSWNPAAFFALFPCLMLGLFLAMLSLPILAKWILMWRYRPGEHLLWSFWMWRMEIAYEIELLVMSSFGPFVNATPLLPWWHRAMGAHIGRRACFINGSIMEADLVHIGDHVSLEGFLQTHLFQDRVMKLGPIALRDYCAVGREGCVLYDSEMAENSSLGDLSLIMNSETFLENRSYHGLPAEHV